MSFVRFGVDGSHVYIYENRDVAKECAWCWLSPRRESFVTSDLDQMLDHVKQHRQAGHVVPDWLDEDLRRAWDDPDLGG